MVTSEEGIGTTEYLKLYTRYRVNRCRYNRGRLYLSCGRAYGINMKHPLYVYVPRILNGN